MYKGYVYIIELEQVLVNRHPDTVELSVIQKFTGVNNKFTVSRSENKGNMFTIYNTETSSCETLPVELSVIQRFTGVNKQI